MPLVPWVQPLLQFGHLRDRLLALRRDEGHAECRERLAIHPARPAGLDVLWTVAAAIGDDDLFVVLDNERNPDGEIGRAWCRDRECQYVSATVVAAPIK